MTHPTYFTTQNRILLPPQPNSFHRVRNSHHHPIVLPLMIPARMLFFVTIFFSLCFHPSSTLQLQAGLSGYTHIRTHALACIRRDRLKSDPTIAGLRGFPVNEWARYAITKNRTNTAIYTRHDGNRHSWSVIGFFGNFRVDSTSLCARAGRLESTVFD